MAVIAPIGWPQPETIQTVTQLWQTSPELYKGGNLFPVEEEKYRNSPKVISWEQTGSIAGRTLAHQMGNDVARVTVPGFAGYNVKTSYYKERITLTEEDLTNLRNLGPADRSRMAGRMVMKAMTTLRVRLAVRKETLRWDAVRGSIVLNENGVKRTINYGVAAAQNVPTYWDNPSLADPIADIQDMILGFRATGGTNPVLWITQYVANLLSRNEVVRGLIRGTGYVGSISSTQVTGLLPMLVGGLGGIMVYDEHWTPDGGTPQPFLYDYQAIMIAQSALPGERIGEFASTPCIHNGGIDNARGGDFYFLDDHTGEANPYMDVVAGVYGIPVIFHPEWIQVWNVWDVNNPYDPLG